MGALRKMSTRILGEDSTASEQEVCRGLAGQEGLDFSPVPCWGLPDLSVYSLCVNYKD